MINQKADRLLLKAIRKAGWVKNFSTSDLKLLLANAMATGFGDRAPARAYRTELARRERGK